MLTIKRWIKDWGITLLAIAPFVIYINEVLGITLFETYGNLKVLGLIFCIVFYQVIVSRYCSK